MTREELEQKLKDDPEFRDLFFRTGKEILASCESLNNLMKDNKKRMITGRSIKHSLGETAKDAKEKIDNSVNKGAEKTKNTFIAILGLALCAAICFIFINLGYALFAIIAAVLGLIIGFFGMFFGVR